MEKAWGQTYYVYLEEMKEEKKGDKAGISEDIRNEKLTFYEISDLENPMMVLNYQKDEQTYSNIYYIENEKVNVFIYQEPIEVGLLYDIQSLLCSYK